MKKFLVFLSAIVIGNAYADTETIKWYVDGSVYNTTTCQSGGDVNLPTQPTKSGYTFVGWEVALYDFSTIDPTINGTNYSAGWPNWSATFSYGYVSGKALCSVSAGTIDVAGTPDETTSGGSYCWCQVTTYKPYGSNVSYSPTQPMQWVRQNRAMSPCTTHCPYGCGDDFQRRTVFRKALLGITQ